MKTSIPFLPSLRLIVFVSAAAAGASTGFAQQQPTYASTYYPAPQPTFGDRVRAAGQSVGDFVRRKFYGEPAPGAAVQQPVYQRPGGRPTGYRAQSYNLDAPAVANPVAEGSTGFQAPDRKSTPKYATPPRETTKPEPVKTEDEPRPAAKPKPKPAPAPAPAPTASKKRTVEPEKPATTKRYTPTKPSAVSKTKPATVRKKVEDQPPTTLKAPTPPEPPRLEAPPEPKTEAKLNKEVYPLPGGIDTPPPTTTSSGIAPTVGGSDFNLTPTDSTPEPKADAKTQSKTASTDTGSTTDVGTKSSGSFMIGKKTSKAGRVISPYAPYNELDITGLPTGSLALDPTTQKVFQVP